MVCLYSNLIVFGNHTFLQALVCHDWTLSSFYTDLALDFFFFFIDLRDRFLNFVPLLKEKLLVSYFPSFLLLGCQDLLFPQLAYL